VPILVTALQGLFAVREGTIWGLRRLEHPLRRRRSGPIVIDLLISSETATAASNLYREHWGDRRVISVICSPQPR
jgi:alkyl sulfatase BDS1-like metallo-beta-lactamase superfamily hydrolase